MQTILDTGFDTNNAEFYRLNKLYDGPEFMKSASESQLRPAKELDPAYYGDPRQLIYPLHTKAATWANYAFFLENCKNGHHRPTDVGIIEDRILHAGQVHGILKSLNLLKEAVAKNSNPTEDCLADDVFAIVLKNDDGTQERYMPIRNCLEVVKAANYLLSFRDRCSYDIRQMIAEKIREKAAALGAKLSPDLSEFVEKQAGYGACTAEDAVTLIEDRVNVSRRGQGELSPIQIEMRKLAAVIREKPLSIREPEVRVKVASVLDDFDRKTGLTRQVKDGLVPRIEDVLFGLTREKMANVARTHTHTINGSIYHLADLELLKLAAVREVIGDDIADALTRDGVRINGEKAAAVLPTLDRHTAMLFERLMSDAGLDPVAKEASHEAIKIDNEFLASIR